ncbi:MAG: hypothetical protein QW331_01935 [Candidatus Woesearchaeota archaeon]
MALIKEFHGEDEIGKGVYQYIFSEKDCWLEAYIFQRASDVYHFIAIKYSERRRPVYKVVNEFCGRGAKIRALAYLSKLKKRMAEGKRELEEGIIEREKDGSIEVYIKPGTESLFGHTIEDLNWFLEHTQQKPHPLTWEGLEILLEKYRRM